VVADGGDCFPSDFDDIARRIDSLLADDLK
jgi:hypothetical protein